MAEAEEQMCRFCFEGPDAGELISPCRCAGGQKYVHLSCLRWWQRTVLIAQPLHPDLADVDTRQRICNVCKAEFTCAPPTRAELLSSFTGPELAALIDEDCVVASAESFSDEVQQHLAHFSERLRDSLVCRHWIRGVFLIVKVKEDRDRQRLFRIGDVEDLDRFLGLLSGDGRSVHLRGRRFLVPPAGPLGGVFEGGGEERRAALREALLPALPLAIRLQPDRVDDCGEDGIVAVNLTRPIKDFDREPLHTLLRARFREATREALQRFGGVLRTEVTHFLGGPCEGQRPAACLLLPDGMPRLAATGPDCLRLAIQAAEAIARGEALPAEDQDGELRELPEATPEPESSPSMPARRPMADDEADGPEPKRRRAGGEEGGATSSSSALAAAGAAAAMAVLARGGAREFALPPVSGGLAPVKGDGAASASSSGLPPGRRRVRLHVFWGYAGWSRSQLMGEIARGSWGLCRLQPPAGGAGDLAEDEPLLRSEQRPEEIWEKVYPRLIFAPKSELSESYGAEEPEAQRRRNLRRLAIYHDLLGMQETRRGLQQRLASLAAASAWAAAVSFVDRLSREVPGGGPAAAIAAAARALPPAEDLPPLGDEAGGTAFGVAAMAAAAFATAVAARFDEDDEAGESSTTSCSEDEGSDDLWGGRPATDEERSDAEVP